MNLTPLLKEQRKSQDGTLHSPDDALIENNNFFNSEIRRTSSSVNAIDLVAQSLVVRGNLIADFCKGGGDQISYAAFFKGGFLTWRV